MPDSNVITGFGGLDGQYSWISENSGKILGLSPQQILEHRLTVVAFPGSATYDQILAEEKQRKSPRLTFRSWIVSARNNGDVIFLGVIGLFLRGDDGEIENVVGAAWPCADCCPICSRMFPGGPEVLRRAVLSLARAALASL